MLEKKTAVDQIEVVGEYSFVQVRTATKVIDDGVEIAKTYHRHAIRPGDDYSGEDAKVQAICAAVHTPEIIESFKTMLSNQERIEP
jgi:ABC-type uncharacterized transport system ATPase subunit